MKNILALTEAVEYIEAHMKTEFSSEDVARNCYISLSGLQKLFRYAFHISLKDYIIRRRMCLAAQELLEGDHSVTEIALEYQYSSPEPFIRAFRKVFGETPTAFRKNRRFSNIYPKRSCEFKEDDVMNNCLRVDISDMFETFRKNAGNCVVCFDIVTMMAINEVSHALGDAAILEAFHRIEEECKEEYLLFRTGGDEFAVITNSDDLKEAEAFAERVLVKNGGAVEKDGKQWKLSLRAGFMKMPERIQQSDEFYRCVNQAIRESVRENR